MKKILTLLMSILLTLLVITPKCIYAYRHAYISGDVETGIFKFSNPEIIDNTLSFTIFDPIELTIEPIDPSITYTNISYTWYLENDSKNPIEIIKAKDKNSLYIPSFNYVSAVANDSGIECVISYFIDGDPNEHKTNVIVDFNIDKSPYTMGSKVCFIGEYTIKQGQTFNLEEPKDFNGKTGSPIGTGTISLNEDGDLVTFNNVTYNFDPSNTEVDELFLVNKGFAYYSFINKLNDINVELIGDNTITNSYHIANDDADGTTFYLSNSTDKSPDAVVAPKYHIKGSGSLTINGGLYGIMGLGVVDIDGKVNINSTKDDKYPGRYGNGIVAGDVIINSNAILNLDIAGNGIQANISNSHDMGFIDFKPGSKTEMTIRNYLRHPYNKYREPSLSAGMISSNTLTIDGSSINIYLVTDRQTIDAYKTLYPESCMGSMNTYSLNGIGNDSYPEYYHFNMNNSTLNIKIECKNYDNSELGTSYARGFHFANKKTDDDETWLNFKNSTLDIDISDTNNNVKVAIGLSTNNVNFDNSNININVNSFDKSYGIEQEKLSFIKDESRTIPMYLKSTNSNVVINSDDIGILGEKFIFDYSDSSKSFIVNGENYGIVSYLLNSGSIEKKYDESYEISNISFINDAHENTSKPINIYSTQTALREYAESPVPDKYYYYETFYNEDKESLAKLIEIKGPTAPPAPDPVPHYEIPKTLVE